MNHARRLRYMDVPSGDRRVKGAQRSDQAPVGRPSLWLLSLDRARESNPPAGAEPHIHPTLNPVNQLQAATTANAERVFLKVR